MATITGTTGNDTLTGGVEDDYLEGLAGDDTIRGGEGNDTIVDGLGADRLYGEGGNDTISINLSGGGRLIADGGAGNDTLSVWSGMGPNQPVTLHGGGGHDTFQLYGFGVDNVVNAGSGNDEVILGTMRAARITLGAGADIVRLGTGFDPIADSMVITDFVAGTDRLEFSMSEFFVGWTGANNPFSEGFIRLLQAGTDTLLQFDRNGGGDEYVTVLRFETMQASAFTPADFGGYPTDGSVPPGQTITGTNGHDDLTGGVGDDTIEGLAGFDTIRGGAGNDVIGGGAGGDYIEGGPGNDTLRGGDGNDTIVDGQGTDSLYGEGGDDILAINLSGGGRLVADGGAGDDTITVSNGGGPNQSVTLRGGGGNDLIVLHGFAADNVVHAGAGNDEVVLGSTLGARVTLGSGADLLRLESNFSHQPEGVVVTDYLPGVDRIDLNLSWLLFGWSGEVNPFAQGFLRLVQVGDDTVLQCDRNGGGDQYVSIIRFKNVEASAFTAADFGGYPPDGSAPPGKTITGTGGDDVDLSGGPGADTIDGRAGHDSIDGGGGNDVLYGRGGNDTIVGGPGNDSIWGGDGDDWISDGQGDDRLYGGSGHDVISVSLQGGERVIADGGDGDDRIDVYNGGGPNQAVTLYGGSGDDQISLHGFAAGNVIDAGSGDDVIVIGSTRAVRITLGAGADLLSLATNFAPETDGVVVTDFLPGTDSLTMELAYLLAGWNGTSNPFAQGFLRLVQDGADTLLQLDGDGGGDGYRTIVRFESVAAVGFTSAHFGGFTPLVVAQTTIIGTNVADDLTAGNGDTTIHGLAGDDVLRGRGGDDVLAGGAGNDVLDGGAGSDTMTGGTGDDFYYVDNAGDLVIELSGEGVDRVQAFIDYTLGDNVENLTLKGAAAVTGTGNGLANVIRGTVGDNTLNGLGGSDELFGREGDDVLNGGGGSDRLEGEAGRDTINGGGGNDQIVGGTQKDTLTGGAGADTFFFGEGEVGASASSADIVTDFSHADGDKIHVRRIDANTGAGGDQNFTFIGDGAFTGVAGQLHYVHAGPNTFIEGDTNGDGLADFVIRLNGLHDLVAGDFVL